MQWDRYYVDVRKDEIGGKNKRKNKRKDEIMQFSQTCMELKGFMLSKVSQREKHSTGRLTYLPYIEVLVGILSDNNILVIR